MNRKEPTKTFIYDGLKLKKPFGLHELKKPFALHI